MHRLVVHCKRSPYDVYVGRPSEWGNPFHVGPEYPRGTAVKEFARWFHAKRHLVERAKAELADKVLGCFCAPRDCHADVLARAANDRGIRVVVTGGRTYDDIIAVGAALNRVRERYGVAVLIHGKAKGADSLCGDWAENGHGIQVVEVPADWEQYGKAAGMLRNREMLDRYFPDLLVAFPGGTGTAGMIKEASARGLPIVRYDDTKGLRWITEKLCV